MNTLFTVKKKAKLTLFLNLKRTTYLTKYRHSFLVGRRR